MRPKRIINFAYFAQGAPSLDRDLLAFDSAAQCARVAMRRCLQHRANWRCEDTVAPGTQQLPRGGIAIARPAI